MLFFHAFREAYQNLSTHAARTRSMGFGIWWAIFVLMLLLGVGNGFHNGISKEFAKYGEKTMIIWKNATHSGYHPIPTELALNLPKQFNTIQQFSPILWYGQPTVRYKEKVATPSVFGCDRCYPLLANLSIKEGRFFTAHDEAEANNLCVIGLAVKEKLFGSASAIGKYILLGNSSLQVVGVLDALDVSLYGEDRSILLTNSFFKKAFPRNSRYVDAIRLTLVPTAHEEWVEAQLRSYFARHLHFDAKDEKELGIFSITKHANKFHKFFKNIAIFTWLIGICFLITGMVGMSNMMLVTIQERTQEMAIRRVLGGRSVEIVAMIVCEVAIVTLMAGCIGLAAGFSLMQLLNQWVVPLCKAYYLSTLTCTPGFMIGGLGLLFLASCLAGMLPAIRAVNIKPVQALGSK